MQWLNSIFGQRKIQNQEILRVVRAKFTVFRNLIDHHNSTLKRISGLEEKYHQGKLAGVSSVWDEFVKIRVGVRETIEQMKMLGGEKYEPLSDRLRAISEQVEKNLPINRPIVKDSYTIPFGDLSQDRAPSVGTKNAILGELKSSFPVPDGYAISAWAYQHFLDSNQLNERIHRLLEGVRIRNYRDLEIVTGDIREAITTKPVPDDLAGAIYTAFDDLVSKTGKPFCALRSSAIGEDTSFSFAGQYLSFLNVRRETLLDQYKQILASKFTPSAIYYLLNHSISDMDLGMGVVCMEVVDAAASGVSYSVDPLDPDRSQMVINSIFGLGKYLVDGTLNPDVFRISRNDKSIISSHLSSKPMQLRLNSEGMIAPEPVPDPDKSSIDDGNLRLLIEYSLAIEKHFGGPQDIEWAIDTGGRLFILQARPLIVRESVPTVDIPARSSAVVLMDGGIPICPGIGIGPVFHLTSVADLGSVPTGAILVTPNPSPYLVAVMDKIGALVTAVGGNTSHLATLARELGVPTVVGMKESEGIENGREVTVDATRGVIYDGRHADWASISGVRPGPNLDRPADLLVKQMIAPIVHLNVIHPGDQRFTPENCQTFHDLLRYIHQKSMEEILLILKRTSNKEKIGLRLKTKIPLIINIIYLDESHAEIVGRNQIRENDIQSFPMRALWGGVLEEGWPQTPIPADLKGFVAVIGADLQGGHKQEFSEYSYAFLSREYMLLNLRMGYHFSTIESMVTDEPAENYIRMQFKLGGAPLERRMRRIFLIGELLKLMGFENTSQGDFLESTLAYQSKDGTLDRLKLLGKITVLTKQLDMALSSDAKARWYFNQFVKKLNLKTREGYLDENQDTG
jgi:pyruvate,water dikinase